jgi:hydroxyacyl-ACP dehydratase HTD2-like protein with hotdog domain
MSIDLSLADLGLPAETTSELSAGHARLVRATIGAATDHQAGDPLPLPWHWAYFPPDAPTAGLGEDGHPRLPEGSPVRPFPRRMWASGKLSAPGQLVLGEPATRHTAVTKVKETTGQSGDLVIVNLEHRYRQRGADQVVEEQTLVYRTPGPPAALPVGDVEPDVPAGGWADRWLPSSPLLFRFSAVTFNSHRIHYDHPYATAVEGYPALVVHGPLTALLVAESARSRFPGGQEVRALAFRASSPLFAELPFHIVGAPDDAGAAVRVLRNDGVEAVTATVGWDSDQ